MKHLILIFALIIPFSFSYAQFSAPATGPSLNIDLKTSYFKPFTKNTASLNDYSLGEQVNNIYWKIDGKTISEATNKRSIDFTTKDVGNPTTLEVFVETGTKKTLSVKRIIEPVYLDIVIEPQTRTPAFYKGRALPSIDSTVNLTALINGNAVTAGEYIYNWTIDNKNIETGPIRGNYKTSAKVPITGFTTVTLNVSNLKGELVARRNVEFASTEPKILFYEVNTLTGIKTTPIDKKLNLIGNSISVRAEPYYLDLNTYNQPDLIEWKIDGVRSPNRGGNPYEVTLANQGSSGLTKVNFHVRNLTDILQGVESNFTINY